MNVRPLHDRIIVQRREEGEQHIGGIIIPDTAKEKPQQHYHAYVRMMIDSKPAKPFSARVLDPSAA